MDTENSTPAEPAQTSTVTASALTWPQHLLALPRRLVIWATGGLGGLVLLAAVYLVGRKNRKGEVNLAVAKKELEQTIAKHTVIQAQLDALHNKQLNIVADILTEETVRSKLQNEKLTDEEIDKRLRADGLLK